MSDTYECSKGLFRRLKMWKGSYERLLSDDCDLCKALKRVTDEVIKSDLEIRDVEYCNAKLPMGEHYLKGVLGNDNRFEIKTYYAGFGWKYLKLSVLQRNEQTKKLQDIIDEIAGYYRRRCLD